MAGMSPARTRTMSTTPPPSPDAAEPTLGAVYELEAATYRSGELRVLSFEGYEEIDGLFAVEIAFWAKDVDELNLQTALLGRPASLGMHLAGGSARYLRGIVRALTVEGKHAAGHHAFRLSLVPRLWLLGKRVNSRVFQDRTVQQIVDAVLEEHGVVRDWNLLGKYVGGQYCVQHQEDDLHFVMRLLAEEGIFFSFTHDDGGWIRSPSAWPSRTLPTRTRPSPGILRWSTVRRAATGP